MQPVENARSIPRQARAQATVGVLLEAAAQLLESEGEAGFNTNAIAERAGVSIGTLYRYFPNKLALITALAHQEMAAANAAFARARAGEVEGLAPDRAVIRAFLQAFGGRVRARRAAITALLAHSDAKTLAIGFGEAEKAFVDAEGEPLSPIAAFVLSRSVHGAMRAAVLEGADFLLSPEFEDELVRLGRAYLGYPAPKRAPTTTAPACS